MTTQVSKVEATLDFLLISDFNLCNLAALLSKDEETPTIRAATTPFGQMMQVLLEPEREPWTETTQGVVVWTLPESVSPSYKKLLGSEEAEPEELMHQVDAFCSSLKAIPSQVRYIFVPTWTTAPFVGRLGLLDMHTRRGLSLALMRMNLRLAENFKDEPRVIVLDAARWIAMHGEKSFSQRLWYMSKTPYNVELLKTASLEIKAALRALMGHSRKLVLLDLDDILWGGILGDVGWPSLRLGGHDPIGEAFKDFQFALKNHQRRGVLLGIVSKNEQDTAMEAIESHPEMVLRKDDFAGWRINWKDKAQNVVDLASEVNLGLQSIVFIDDNPVERARVREALPEVLVPEWPENAMDYTSALHRLRCFDTPSVSTEDRIRTDLYLTERKRREARAQVGSLDEWLKSLNMHVTADPLSEATLDRAVQLFNKTNQMNLSTRRLAKEELWHWSRQDENHVVVFRISDKFGDYGIAGIGSLSLRRGAELQARLVDFILSCRVMGRKVEETMLHVLVELAKRFGAKALEAEYIPTSKNQPCLGFLENSGLAKTNGGTTYFWSAAQTYPQPPFLTLAFDPGSPVCPAEIARDERILSLA
jgi:FkbH-like protein